MGKNKNSTIYVIDLDDKTTPRDLATLVAARKCYECRQMDTSESVMASDPHEHLERIAEHCKDTADYLLPDTPLKESIFRVMLAGSNEPVTADEVSQTLSEIWVASSYPRNLSPDVIGRLLDHSDQYDIRAVTEPESDENDKATGKTR